MQRFFESTKSVPILFVTITILAYGLLLPFTGFYWDDWPFAWSANFLGPKEFFPSFAPFRPFLAPIFFVTTSLIPINPLYWQIFALVIRFLIGITAWWTFKQIWRDKPVTALTLALFILVFPGYSQHWVAFTHINQELLPFLFYLLSFGFTFKALHAEKPSRFLIPALLFQILGIFPTEYFFGIEGLRFLFLFFFFHGTFKERFTQAIKQWAPYLFIWILNAAWLVYYYRFGGYSSYEVRATQSLSLASLLSNLLDAVWKAGFYIWGQVLVLMSKSIMTPASLLTFGLIAISFVFLSVYLFRISTTANEDNRAFSILFITIGTLGILLGRLPSLAAGLPLTLQSSYDRFMVSMMIGGSLFILGLIELLFGKNRFKPYVIALVVSLGIGQQFFNANIFRRDWSKQSEIYWQLAWRIPTMEPNTVLLTHQMPIDYETDNSFTAPINWMYAPYYQRGDLPYAMLYTEKRVGGSILPDLELDQAIQINYRTVTFNGNTSQVIVIFMPPNGCLRVLDPALGDAETYEKESHHLVNAIHLSDPSLIHIGEKNAIPAFFPEPRHDWCYYYTKAELARQIKDWEGIIDLEKEVNMNGYSPDDPFEWLPFIEANAMLRNMDHAKELSETALETEKRIRKGVCNVWKRVQAQDPDGGDEGTQIKRVLSEFQCPQ
jgi:hypothetical protein